MLDASKTLLGEAREAELYRHTTAFGRPVLTVQSVNRQGVTVRFHAGSGSDIDTVVQALRDALVLLDQQGRGLQR